MFYYLKLVYLLFYNFIKIPLTYFLFKFKVITREEYNKTIKDIIIYNGPVFIKYVQLVLIDKEHLKKYLSIDLIKELTDLEDKIYTNIRFKDNVVINNTIHLQHYYSSASGSICGIYEFPNNNEIFIIKKKHKNIEEHISIGYIVLQLIVYILKNISLKYKSILSIIDIITFKSSILQQCNMVYEANNLQQFYNLYNRYKIINIPNYLYNNEEMIIMKKLDGYKFNDFMEKFPDYKEECYYVLISSIYLMIRKKLLHGDFHLGNILFNIENNRVVINIYDFGIIFNLNDIQSESLLNYIETFKNNHLTTFLKTFNKNITEDLINNRHKLFLRSESNYTLNLSYLSSLKIPLEIINILSILCYIKILFINLDINKLFSFMIENDILE